MGDVRKYLEAVFNGQIPIKRKNPQTGIEENVYYRYDDKNEELIEEKNIPWFDYRRITYPLAVSDFSDKMETGEYRTLKSSIPENWGKKTEIALNNYLAANYEEPDYLKYNIIKNLLGKISPFWKNI